VTQRKVTQVRSKVWTYWPTRLEFTIPDGPSRWDERVTSALAIDDIREAQQRFAAPVSRTKLCLETAGSSLEQVLKCNVYCTSIEKFAAVNAVYARYFSKEPPARVFVNVPAWPGPFDIEIDCIAAI
jgi:enamine deaminase RidA (YjgF/YER057c/UK114 family)